VAEGKAMDSPKVVVVGLGYIGLPTAALIASKGVRVTGVDINPSVVRKVNRGGIHIVEPDLEGLVRYVVTHRLLRAEGTPCNADVFIIAVPTPCTDDRKPDLTFVQRAFADIAPFCSEWQLDHH
jgi:UDP-N-acetyl-D-mannosaminuronic acid dehydrogenase